MARERVMSALAQAVNEYLQVRRALGYKLEREGRELPRFVEFLEQRGAVVITRPTWRWRGRSSRRTRPGGIGVSG